MVQFDPSSTSLPKRKDLPSIPGAPAGAAWFWGPKDEVSGYDSEKDQKALNVYDTVGASQPPYATKESRRCGVDQVR